MDLFFFAKLKRRGICFRTMTFCGMNKFLFLDPFPNIVYFKKSQRVLLLIILRQEWFRHIFVYVFMVVLYIMLLHQVLPLIVSLAISRFGHSKHPTSMKIYILVVRTFICVGGIYVSFFLLFVPYGAYNILTLCCFHPSCAFLLKQGLSSHLQLFLLEQDYVTFIMVVSSYWLTSTNIALWGCPRYIFIGLKLNLTTLSRISAIIGHIDHGCSICTSFHAVISFLENRFRYIFVILECEVLIVIIIDVSLGELVWWLRVSWRNVSHPIDVFLKYWLLNYRGVLRLWIRIIIIVEHARGLPLHQKLVDLSW